MKTLDQETLDWLDVRKKAALEIDPAIAEVDFEYGQTMDPYGVLQDLPEELQQVGREWFARNPNGGVWVSFHDLPAATVHALEEKRRRANAAGWRDIIDGMPTTMKVNDRPKPV